MIDRPSPARALTDRYRGMPWSPSLAPLTDTVGGLSRCSVRSCWHQKCLTARPAVMRLKNHTNGVPWVRLSGGLSHQTVEAGSSRLSVHSFGLRTPCADSSAPTTSSSHQITRTRFTEQLGISQPVFPVVPGGVELDASVPGCFALSFVVYRVL
jgi:hypothetical protein